MFTPTPKQEEGIRKAKEWYMSDSMKPFVIMGIAGSGKSSLVNYLIHELGLSIDKEEVVFCTFTGKAASVLTNKGNKAQTIHRLIYNPFEIVDKVTKKTKIIFKIKDSLPEEIKLIVIDECFMVSDALMKDLMSFGKRIICLGDNKQLPPPFGSTNDLYKHPDVYLNKPMRQALDSPIIYLANKAVNHERIQPGDYGNIQVRRKTEIPLLRMKEADQIIAGKNATVKNLNNYYRNAFLNIPKDQRLPLKGERLLCLKNNWNLFCNEGIFETNLVNGLNLILESDISENTTIEVSSVDLRPEFMENKCFKNIMMDLLPFKYSFNKVEEIEDNKDFFGYRETITKRELLFGGDKRALEVLTYGYVITCHKAQGSEFKDVFFIFEPMGKKSYWELLYTGITRASENLTLII